MIVDSTGAAARHRSDGRAGSAAGESTDGRSSSGADTDTFHRFTDVMMAAVNGVMIRPVVPVIVSLS